MRGLTEEQLDFERALITDDYTEYYKKYPLTFKKCIIGIITFIPNLFAYMIICR